MPRTVTFTVSEAFAGKKLCAFLRGEAQISYALCATLRHIPGAVTRDGVPVRSIDRADAGDRITVAFPREQTALIPTPMALDILYEDDDLLVLNKSGSIAMHPSHGHQDDTLANGVTHYFRSTGQDAVFHAVGRLDKGTSGVVICAKHSYAASRTAPTVQKVYLARTEGIPPQSGTVCAPIVRPDPDKTLRCVGEGGEHAVTHYRVLQADNGRSLVEVRPETGRTHQIRVHMAYIGTPLTGDSLYGTAIPALGRHLLHCRTVQLTHPVTQERMTFTAPLPPEFSHFS